MKRSMIVSIATVCATLALGVGTAAAEVHRIDVRLFMPCTQEIAVRATESLRAVPGVEEVELTGGRLDVRIITGEGFDSDPLALVQLLWEGKIFPNRIYVEATGRIVPRGEEVVFIATGTDQAFTVRRSEPIPEVPATSSGERRYRLEVLDWIEDRELPPDERYSVRVLDVQD